MSYINLDGATVKLNDEVQDAFGRVRVSQPHTIFSAKFTYGTEEGLYFTSTSGTSSATFLPNESAFLLSVDTAAGDQVIRETFQSFLYLPGKSHSITMTGVMGAPKANVTQQIGYFDNSDGVYFEQDSTSKYVVVQSSTSGAVVKTAIAQADWNRDKLDGTGSSGITIDFSKAQIFIIDLQWLGVGRIRYGFNIDGHIVYCHEINNANNVEVTYMRTAQLPLRYVLTNTGATASPSTMRQISSSISSEGGEDPAGPFYYFNSGNTPIELPLNTDVIVATWRLRPVVSGNPNRSFATFLAMDIIPSAKRPFVYEFVMNPTLTGANFQPSGFQSSVIDIDQSATSLTGGERRYGGIANDKMTLGTIENFSLIPGMEVSLVLRAINVPMNAWVTMNWREIS